MSFNDRQKRCLHALEDTLKLLRRKDFTPETMQTLTQRFASPAGILESSVHSLRREGLPEADAQLLRLIPDLARYTRIEQFGDHPKIDRLSIAGNFLKPLYIGVPVEQFNVLYLDGGGRLIERKMLQSGSVDETPFYLAHLLQDVIFTGASAIVLSHNHPGGTLRPSRADVACTLNTISALFPLEIILLDHIIIAGDQAISMRDIGAIEAPYWIGQNPSSVLLRDWLDVKL